MTGNDSPLLAIRDLRKSFGATQALAGVSLDVAAGEVHGLIGQNGSGKSTLIKLLSGYHSPDAGDVRLDGRSVRLPAPPGLLRRLGLAFVHQDLGLVGRMSVLENLRVGRYRTGRSGRIRWRDERARATDLLRRFELAVDPDTPLERLSQTQQAIVAILRALHDLEEHRGGGLLVLDEPTAALPAHEIHELFAAVRRVAAGGSGVMIVTHNLDEVFEITDRVSILRDGRLIDQRRTADLTQDALIELMLGRALSELYPPAAGTVAESRVLEVRGLRGRVVRDVDFEVRRGEIVGMTGLIGAGHDEVPYLVHGAPSPRGGRIAVDGAALPDPSPQRARAAGLALLPGDRQRQSAILRASVKENVTLPTLGEFQAGGRLKHRRERSAVQAVLERFDVRPRDPDRPMSTLSGGNQQKALLGRCLRLEPRVLLLDEPTQGVDVGARRGIFGILREAAANGTAIVYTSVEYEDLAHVCDRVLVFQRGRIVAELAGAALSHEAIVANCYRTGVAA